MAINQHVGRLFLEYPDGDFSIRDQSYGLGTIGDQAKPNQSPKEPFDGIVEHYDGSDLAAVIRRGEVMVGDFID